jgi:hypothetical protein
LRQWQPTAKLYYKDTNPVMSRLGRTTLDRLLTGR